MKIANVLTVFFCFLALLAGCQKGSDETGGQGAGSGGLVKGRPDPAQHRKTIKGKVITRKEAGKYSFLELDTGSGNIWVAAQKGKVKTGDTVEFIEIQPMVNFFSKTLDKTFEKVYFLGSLKVNGEWVHASPQAFNMNSQGARGTAASPAASSLGGMPSSTAPAAGLIKVEAGSISKVAGGYTVGELFKNKADLDGKSTKVRGKVQKFLTGIMGRNFLHLVDGTGGEKTNDLTLTTSDMAKVGDTVVVEGKITLNKDFGSGYKYELLMEDAKVTVE
ncbi:MAG: hypothetical protein ACE5FU_14100 [Nitrospinota bacterium]